MMANKHLQPAGGVCFGNLKHFTFFCASSVCKPVSVLQVGRCEHHPWRSWRRWPVRGRSGWMNVLNMPELHWIKDLQITWSPKCSLPLYSSDPSPCDPQALCLLLTMLPCTSFPPILLQLPFSFLFLPAGLTVCVCCSLFVLDFTSFVECLLLHLMLVVILRRRPGVFECFPVICCCHLFK